MRIHILGGMGFSRLFSVTGDLALVILVHWAVTFLNTPSAPKGLNDSNLRLIDIINVIILGLL